jgi:hypothetical protein
MFNNQFLLSLTRQVVSSPRGIRRKIMGKNFENRCLLLDFSCRKPHSEFVECWCSMGGEFENHFSFV